MTMIREDIATRVYDALMAAGKRALADEVAAAAEQLKADLKTLTYAADEYAEHLVDNIESMREDDGDRVTDTAELNAILEACARWGGEA